jgi:hypothetical protein
LKLMSERSFAKVFFSRKNQNSVGRVASQGRKERKVFMKKVLLIVAMLLVVSPVMATVTITATQQGTYWADPPTDHNEAAIIMITYSGLATDPNIRAFALDMNVDSNCGFWNIRDYNVGENNSSKQGYGIFPGRFRAFVNATSPNWVDTNYTPLAAYNDPGASNTGIGYGIAIAELGYLGATDANMPAKSGTLFRIDVNSYGWTGTANLTIAADTMRGGVVSKDSNATTTSTNLPVTIPVVFPPLCTTPTNEVGVARATAEGVWTGQGFTLCGTGVVNCAQVGNIITQDSGCYTLPYCINYTYGIQATEPNIVGKNMTDANATLAAAGITLTGITYEPNGLKTALTVDRENPVAGTSTCSASYVVDTNCLYVGRVFTTATGTLTVTSAMVNTWNNLGRPNCWCCASQKLGNGVYTGSSATKTDAVDLAQVKNAANFNKNDTTSNACLDFNLSGKIDAADLAIVKNSKNFNKVTGPAPPCQ